MSDCFDISPEVSESIAVFPGDTPYRRKVVFDFDPQANYRLSSLEGTVHLGAHADAPSHYHPDGAAISERALSFYFGPCQVISVKKAPGERIVPEDLTEITAKRVLFKTGSFPDPDKWVDDFNSLSPELVDALAAKNVVLVGIDTPSIDPSADKELVSHQAVYRNDMAVLEGLVLAGVPDGRYLLSALPLRLKGADAAPVRAALFPFVEGME